MYVALNARGFAWLSVHTTYSQVKKDCLKKAGLSIGESNILDKMTNPRQLIFWDIGWLIKQIKGDSRKKQFQGQINFSLSK